MKSLSIMVLVSSLSFAPTAFAQTSTPSSNKAQGQQAAAPAKAKSSSEQEACVGPASYCTVYFGGS